MLLFCFLDELISLSLWSALLCPWLQSCSVVSFVWYWYNQSSLFIIGVCMEFSFLLLLLVCDWSQAVLALYFLGNWYLISVLFVKARTTYNLKLVSCRHDIVDLVVLYHPSPLWPITFLSGMFKLFKHIVIIDMACFFLSHLLFYFPSFPVFGFMLPNY